MRKVIRKPLIAFALTTVVGVTFVSNSRQGLADTALESALFSTTVNNNCQLKNPVPVAFGTYDPVVTNAVNPLDVNGSFVIKCSKGGSGTLSINSGLNPAGVTRRMKSGSNFLTYNLYTSAARNTIWNESNTVAYGPSPSGNDFTEIVYGRIPGAQINAVAGSYSDTVIVTVAY